MTDWQVLAVEDVPSGTVSIAADQWPSLGVKSGERVKVSVGGRTRYLSAYRREGAEGRALFVTPGAFAGAEAGAQLRKVTPVSAFGGRIFRTPSGLLSLLGLVLAIAGTVLQAVNSLHDRPSAALVAVGSAIQIAGLLLVFFKSV